MAEKKQPASKRRKTTSVGISKPAPSFAVNVTDDLIPRVNYKLPALLVVNNHAFPATGLNSSSLFGHACPDTTIWAKQEHIGVFGATARRHLSRYFKLPRQVSLDEAAKPTTIEAILPHRRYTACDLPALNSPVGQRDQLTSLPYDTIREIVPLCYPLNSLLRVNMNYRKTVHAVYARAAAFPDDNFIRLVLLNLCGVDWKLAAPPPVPETKKADTAVSSKPLELYPPLFLDLYTVVLAFRVMFERASRTAPLAVVRRLYDFFAAWILPWEQAWRTLSTGMQPALPAHPIFVYTLYPALIEMLARPRHEISAREEAVNLHQTTTGQVDNKCTKDSLALFTVPSPAAILAFVREKLTHASSLLRKAKKVGRSPSLVGSFSSHNELFSTHLRISVLHATSALFFLGDIYDAGALHDLLVLINPSPPLSSDPGNSVMRLFNHLQSLMLGSAALNDEIDFAYGRERQYAQVLGLALGLFVAKPMASLYDVVAHPNCDAHLVERLLNFYGHSPDGVRRWIDPVENLYTLTNSSSPWFPRSSHAQLRVVVHLLDSVKGIGEWRIPRYDLPSCLYWAYAVLSVQTDLHTLPDEWSHLYREFGTVFVLWLAFCRDHTNGVDMTKMGLVGLLDDYVTNWPRWYPASLLKSKRPFLDPAIYDLMIAHTGAGAPLQTLATMTVVFKANKSHLRDLVRTVYGGSSGGNDGVYNILVGADYRAFTIWKDRATVLFEAGCTSADIEHLLTAIARLPVFKNSYILQKAQVATDGVSEIAFNYTDPPNLADNQNFVQQICARHVRLPEGQYSPKEVNLLIPLFADAAAKMQKSTEKRSPPSIVPDKDGDSDHESGDSDADYIDPGDTDFKMIDSGVIDLD